MAQIIEVHVSQNLSILLSLLLDLETNHKIGWLEFLRGSFSSLVGLRSAHRAVGRSVLPTRLPWERELMA